MAISGSWKRSAVDERAYAGARKWGTGINPVHAHDDNTGRNIAPGGLPSPPEEILGPEQWGYCGEDMPGISFGYVREFPAWDTGETYHRQTDGYPAWDGQDRPGGTQLRGQDHGQAAAVNYRRPPRQGVTSPWTNKVHGEVVDAVVSDPAQYEVATSMRQRTSALGNDRAQARGTDAPRASLPNRLTGVKERHYSRRGDEMDPVSQDLMFRAWHGRAAGVGPKEFMDLNYNEWPSRTPMTHTSPPDPDMGDSAANYGYSAGDFYG